MFFIYIVRILVINQVFGFLEVFRFKFTVLLQIFVSKWRWKKNNHAHKLKNIDPS
jgi:hypothetical protein